MTCLHALMDGQIGQRDASYILPLIYVDIFSCEATLDNTQNVPPSLNSLHHYRNYMLPLHLEA